MKIRLENKWVCSVCWSVWKGFHRGCEFCGARSNDPDGVDSEGKPLLSAGIMGKEDYETMEDYEIE
jgi:hypothetical protein